MDGFYFYWLMWIFFIIAFFFLNDEKLRDRLSLWLLTIILLSGSTFNIFSLQISLNTIFLLLSSYFFMRKVSSFRVIYYYFLAAIIMLSYTSFQLFALYDPAWLIVDEKIMLISLLCYVVMMLTPHFSLQAVLLICGVIQGDILYGFILSQLQFPYMIGSFFIFDTLAISIGILLSIFLFKKLSIYFSHYFKTAEGEKRRTL